MHFFGLWEYTTGSVWLDRSLSWHQVARLTFPLTSKRPPELPSAPGTARTEVMAVWRGLAAAKACVATRPSVVQMTVTRSAAILFIASVPPFLRFYGRGR